MIIPDAHISAIAAFIESAYSSPMKSDQIQPLIPLATKILRSDYLGVLLFANKHAPAVGYLSNNTAGYASLYQKYLQPRDFLLRAMISGGGVTTLSSFSSEVYLRNKEFCVQAIRGRPISDICYVPLRIHNYLAGYIAVSRAGIDRHIAHLFSLGKVDAFNETYTPNEVALISFLGGVIIDGYALALEGSAPDEASADLDAFGTVLRAGDEIRTAMQELFCPDSWQTPCAGTSPIHAFFRRKLHSFVDCRIGLGSRDFTLSKGGRNYRFVLHLHGDESMRLHFPHEPIVRLELRRPAGSSAEKDYLPVGLAGNRYSFTPREMEVARLICRAFSNQEISAALAISVPTVKRHISTIFEKTGTGSRTQLLFVLSC